MQPLHQAPGPESVPEAVPETVPKTVPGTCPSCFLGRPGIWLLPPFICIAVNLAYMLEAYFPNHRYLEWANNSTAGRHHLPDLIFDLHSMNEPNWVTVISDAAPGVLLGLAGVLCLLRCDSLLWARLFHLQALFMFLNGIAENVTILPATYGYQRCIAYMHISGPEEDSFGLKPTGSCAAMIWSGHTFHTVLGVYIITCVLEKDFGWRALSKPICGCGPKLRIVVWLSSGIVIAVPLLLNKAHYPVDIFLALVIAMLAFSNEALLRCIDSVGKAEALCCSSSEAEDQ